MRRMWTTFALAAAISGNTLAVGAQEKRERRPAPSMQEVENELVVTQSGEGPGVEMKGDNFVFVSTEMSFAGELVKGAPYSAQAVTESVQTLADGNRIVRRNSANVYRDAEGRTRRETTISHVGPFATMGDAAQTLFIQDPVAGVNYILDPREKTARKLPALRLQFRTERREGAAAEKAERRLKVEDRVKVEVEAAAAAETHGFVFNAPVPAPGAPGVVFYRHSSKAETKTEKLEKRIVEGVEAEGSRTVTTIPAGEFGNELPIQIVNERWYSPELQVVVMTRHSDPRSGETTYRLTNINRAAPDASLFQVPADYSIKEGPVGPRGGVRRMRMKTPASEN